ncbi:MAG TPA: serine--tRNA ligase [Ktedonobacterales bacterium]|nr:serine--tRNA ligase [Ktedonobacterales bacterium]
MLSDSLLRNTPDVVRIGLRRRYASPGQQAALAECEDWLDAWRALDAERRVAITRRDELARARRTNQRVNPATDTAAAREEQTQARQTIVTLEAQMRALALRLPNLPDARVPDGADASANVVLRRWGEPPAFDFTPRPHDELGAALGIFDMRRATKLAGPRFPLLVGAGARLARALAALMLDLHRERGYIEVSLPHLLRAATLEGSAHLPRYQDDLYAIAGEGLYLSPTAEAQLVALHAHETLAGRALPLAYTAVSPAFRREAGSANAQTHGLLRQHQFDKVELVRVTTPEDADTAFETLLADAEAVLQRLGLPYRVVALCAGELPFSAQRTCDIEVWMGGQPEPDGRPGGYVEVSSVSDCGSFQARRLGLRYTPIGGGHTRFPHTLNGSALAIGRTLAALLEHGQRADGSVALPAALAPYLPERTLEKP